MYKIQLEPQTCFFPSLSTIITSYDEENHPKGILNIWITNASFTPPTVVLVVKREKDILNAIVKSNCFGVNLINVNLMKSADIFGQTSKKNCDKFKETNLTIFTGKKLHTPLIQECPINFECRLIHRIDISDTVLLIGEIVNIWSDKELLNDRGHPDDFLVKTVLQNLTNYFSLTGPLAKVGFSSKN